LKRETSGGSSALEPLFTFVNYSALCGKDRGNPWEPCRTDERIPVICGLHERSG